ncbi:zinc finger protein 1024 [Cheilinus undulatus]|uniref:zinc finger protein 1024 n=1 Tax=Cheilinus undulatus TaxID=241271 RepID=UPI001BD4C449|nr:zinc finger protein 1024 [Cheilinus undulatus]
MLKLRSFVHQRLYAAAEDILGEVEKILTLALYEADVQRPNPEPDGQRPEPSRPPLISEPPLINSDFPEEKTLHTSTPPLTHEESNFSKAVFPGPSKTIEERHIVQIDFEIKEEQEEHGRDSQSLEVICPHSKVVKTEQLENQVLDEIQLFSSDGCEAETEGSGSDEDWVQNKEAQMYIERQITSGNSSAKSHRDYHVCPACGKAFQYIRPFVKHIKKHRNNESIRELLKSLQSFNSQAFICDFCGKRFTSSGGLKVHSKIHAGIKDFKCQVCGITFVQKGNLMSHLRTHSGERPFACDICGKAFSQKQNLTVHRRRHAKRDGIILDQWGNNTTVFP